MRHSGKSFKEVEDTIRSLKKGSFEERLASRIKMIEGSSADATRWISKWSLSTLTKFFK